MNTAIYRSALRAVFFVLCLIIPAMTAKATTSDAQKPIVLKTMGSVFFGGNVTTNKNGVTFHGDHGYAQYYIPQNSHNLPLVMWHGMGQSGKTFESTPDGREGFQAILTRRDWSVYIIDQPRRGRAGRTQAPLVKNTAPTTMLESHAWDAFRFGLWIPPKGPTVFPNVQMPMDGYTIDQFFRQQTPDTGEEPRTAEYRTFMGKTVGKLFVMTGPGILITHSNSGQYGWTTAMAQPELVKAIVAYEPGNYVFPGGETSENTTINAPTVPLAEFKKLTRMPIVVIFGDNIAKTPSNNFNSEVWRTSSLRGKQFVEAVNRYGGDARIVFLPDLGIKGNTHIPFADLNNIDIADHLEKWLHDKGLNGRDKPYAGPQKKTMDLTIPLKK